MRKAIKNIDLNGEDIPGETLFMNACINGHLDIDLDGKNSDLDVGFTIASLESNASGS